MDVPATLQEMTEAMSSTRGLIHSLNAKFQSSPEEFETREGISLLSLKYHVLLSYLRSLTILSSRRALGHSLLERSLPKQPFGDKERDERGANCGDLVDSLIEDRLVLEKVKILEGRMKYQIDKLVKLAKEDERANTTDVLNDPLAFRPNPQNLVNNDEDPEGSDSEESSPEDRHQTDGIYKPPRLAPMPYVPPTSSKTKNSRQRQPKALTSLLYSSDPSQPHVESVSGLGGPAPSTQITSSRAKYLKDLTEFEESQFGRVMLGRKEEKRRKRDEAILSMGGTLSGVGQDGSGGRTAMRAGGLEDEFMDVIRDNGSRASRLGDGYDELRKRAKKGSALERSRNTKKLLVEDVDGVQKKRKRSRFEMERKNIKKLKS